MNTEEKTISNDYGDFPQYLCKMCGKCCKAIIPETDYEELKIAASEGDEEAKVFVNVFNRYPSVKDARKVVPDHVDQIIEELKKIDKYDLSKLNFYYCPYITVDNLCSIHEERPDCCRRAPRNGWSLFPPDCGFKGWQFEMRERHKKSIRFLKEYLYEAEQTKNEDDLVYSNLSLKEFRTLVENKIKPWERYGARYW